jgi:transcription elongation factor Elf1
MNNKKCVFCESERVVKNGFQNNVRVWKCKSCNKKFQANRRALPDKEEIFKWYTFKKQTLNEVNNLYHVGTKEIQNIIDEITLPTKVHNPREIYLVVDATYFGGRKNPNSFCVIVFRDFKKRENVWFKFSKSETKLDYLEGKRYLVGLGYVLRGITGDGLNLIREAFSPIPFQMCHVHMERIIIRGTTRSPELEAGRALLAIVKTLKYTKKKLFEERMQKYTEQFSPFLNEKTTSQLTGKTWYVHKELRQAFLSLRNLHPFLFNNKSDSNLQRTTNTLEGFFTHLKLKVAAHKGLSKDRKQKLISAMVLNNSTSSKITKKKE